MLKIKKLTKDSCEVLLSNLKNNFELKSINYTEHKLDSFISLVDELPKIENDGFFEINNELFDYKNQMKLNGKNGSSGDLENSILIYEAFNKLTPLDANDPRLWIRLTHDHCHKYVVDRWFNTSKGFDVIKERFFFEGASQSARLRNAISRLWWIAHLTIDQKNESESSKYRYTEAVCNSQDLITSIFERTMGAYPNVRFGILDFYIENEEYFKKDKSKKIQVLAKDLNNYGGVTLLTLLSQAEVKDICQRLTRENL